ncbi:MAG TPA: FMN-binding protein [Acidimicrobiales bacterium]|nr:FMN-binding protein [Acidimicrobiales bacterium]
MKHSRSKRPARRAQVVLSGTALGLVGVLSFRTSPTTLSIAGLSSSATTTTVAGSRPPSTGGSTTTTTAPPVSGSSTTTTTPGTATAATRSATGPTVNYYFGTLSVKVTATGSKIDAVSIASLSDGGNPRSQSIDQQAIPMLIQQVMAAQSSQIQGVSGATYTSSGFYTSLTAALKDLGLR